LQPAADLGNADSRHQRERKLPGAPGTLPPHGIAKAMNTAAQEAACRSEKSYLDLETLENRIDDLFSCNYLTSK